jgi:hypothetical protein
VQHARRSNQGGHKTDDTEFVLSAKFPDDKINAGQQNIAHSKTTFILTTVKN